MSEAGVSQTEFQFALAIWTEASGISQQVYMQLRDVLCLLPCEETHQLPLKLDTLKRNLHEQLPMLPIHNQKIDVTQHIQANERHGGENENAQSWQYWYNPDQLFASILKAQYFRPSMHFGMAEYSDHPNELWHSRAWGSSVCTVSGEFALSKHGQILFPGDFIQFEFCDIPRFGISVNYGRVTFVGVDRRQTSNTKDKVILTVQPVVLTTIIEHLAPLPCGDVTDPIYILLEDMDLELEDRSAHCRIDMTLNRGLPLCPGSVQVNYVLNTKSYKWRSSLKVHALRAEIEVAKYGRDLLETRHSANSRVRSIPILMFIDDFGIFRNMYRALKAFYVTLAGLPYSERRKIVNNFTLTLGPHGADLEQCVLSFKEAFQDLLLGKEVCVNGENVLLNISVVAFTADMPQQAVNSGALAHQANIGCRSCYCPREHRGDMEYDTIENGRYYFDVALKRFEGQGIMGKSQSQYFFRKHGLQKQASPLEELVPSLDVTLGCAYDIPHSEWKGLGLNLQKVLCECILNAYGLQSYYTAFQKFVIPVQWARIQSPQHQRSWSLSENGRAILLTPLILRCNASEDWFRPQFLERAAVTLSSIQGENSPHPVWQWILHAYSLFAAAISALSSTKFISVDEVRKSAVLSRKIFQLLMITASKVPLDAILTQSMYNHELSEF